MIVYLKGSTAKSMDHAIKKMKKNNQREGLFRELKIRRYFEKPSIKKARKHAEAVRRSRKIDRKKVERILVG